MEFAKRGAKVILACRNEKKANEARHTIIQLSGNPNIVVRTVDLSSFKSVRDFAKVTLDTEDRLDILVNNAGMHVRDDEISPDGLLMQMQVNYYAHVLLTLLLIGKYNYCGR